MKSLLNSVSSAFLHHGSWAGYFEPVVQCFLPAWRDGYYRAQVKHIRQFAKHSLEVTLTPQKSWPMHLGGQHLALTLEINGRLVTRIFTIASGANEFTRHKTLRLLIRTQDSGALTPHLSALQQGDWVNISAPQGEFLLPRTSQPLVMLAGGSGITPFLAMLAAISDGDPRPITLLYYAQKNGHWFTHELAQRQAVLPGFEYQLLDREKDGDAATTLASQTGKQWLVCGPPSLYAQAAQLADASNTPIASEHFAALPPLKVGSEKAQFTLWRNKQQFTIDNQQTLLTQLQANDQPVTVGCGMGICHQCQCVKKRGVVRDIRTGELSDNAEQLIQLCVSQAVSDLELSA